MLSTKKHLIIYRTQALTDEKLQFRRIHGCDFTTIHQSSEKSIGYRRRKYIQEIYYEINLHRQKNKEFIKLISSNVNMKKVSILPFSCPFSDNNQYKELKYVTRNLCLRMKRINKLSLPLKEENQKDMQSFHSLSLLNNLRYLTLDFDVVRHSSNVQALQVFLEKTLKRKSWPQLKLQVFKLYLPYADSGKITPDQVLLNFSKALRDLDKITKFMPTKLELDVFLNKECSSETAIHFSETLKVLSHYSSFVFNGILSELYFKVCEEVYLYEKLEGLSVGFLLRGENDPIGEDELLKVFQESLMYCESLKNFKLSLQFRNFRGNYIPYKLNQVLIDLSQYLSELKLQSLVLEISPRSSSEESQEGISSIFSSIGSLRNLKELNLSFTDFGSNISDKELKTLCVSLTKLKKLRSLSLDLSSGNISDLGIQYLEHILRFQKKVEDLTLCLESCKQISVSVMAKFVVSLSQLQYLSSLKLELRELEIDNIFIEALMKTVPQFKFLSEFILILPSSQNEDVIENLEKWLQCCHIKTKGTVGNFSF